MSWTVRSVLVWRSWGEGEFVVYNEASGDTHLLDESAAAILAEVQRGTETLEALVDRLADRANSQSRPLIHQHVSAMIEELDALGLIEPLS